MSEVKEESVDWFGVLMEYYFPVLMLMFGGLVISIGLALVYLPLGIVCFGIAAVFSSYVCREQHNVYISVRHDIAMKKRYY